MPRVLQVVLSLNPGGTERLVLEIAKRLHSDIPMTVCCLDDRGSWAIELETCGIEVVELGRRPGFRPGLSQAIAGLIRAHRISVVHAHQYSPFVYSALARLWHPRSRVVFTEHGRLSDAPPSPKRRVINSVLTKLSSATFAVSADVRSHLMGEGFAGGAVEVIYNGIDAGSLPDGSARQLSREALGLHEDTVAVGTIARLDPVKDLGTLIRAVALASRDVAVGLVIVGDGAERRALEKVAEDEGVQSQVRFLGQRDDARRWLAACDVYVNSSISEGVSLTILEAMAAGLPVVATRVGGTPEVVDESCGRLVPARDAQALAGVLRELARNPTERGRLGRSARARVETQFTLDRMVAAYGDVYRRLG